MKFFNFFLLIILIISAGIFSCNEDDPIPEDKVRYGDGTRTKIEGKVLEYGTNKPLSGFMVVLEEEFYFPGSGGGTFYPIDTTYTDNNGFYQYDFIHEPDSKEYYFDYQVKAIHPFYFPNTREIESGYAYKRDIIIDPYGWIKVHIKNVNPFDNNDYLFTSIDGGGGHYYGKDIDLQDLRIRKGNRKAGLFWTITKNKITTEHFDSLYLPAFDTVQYEILY